MTKLNYLKLKKELKSLAKEIREAKNVRREVERNYSNSNYSTQLKNITMSNSEDILKMFKDNPYRAVETARSEHKKRCWTYRHKHIVYCLARGRTIEQIELKVREGNERSNSLIEKYKEQYGFDESIEVVEKEAIAI